MRNGIRWSGDLTRTSILKFDAKARAGITAAAKLTATRGVTYMRTNAPWNDQTGNARNGLQAKVVVNPRLVAVVFYHSVPYGIWLEVRWGGTYAIIRPTVQAMGPEFMKAAEAIFR